MQTKRRRLSRDGYVQPLRFTVLMDGEVIDTLEDRAARSLARHLRAVHQTAAVNVTYDNLEPLLGSWVDYFSA